MDSDRRDRLVTLRRELHRHPEPAWCEFYTTARIIEAVETIGVDELLTGRDVVSEGDRLAVPDDPTLEEWQTRAIDAGADPDHVDTMAGGFTGAVAVLRNGDGPTVGLRVDIDALRRSESTDDDHQPAAEGFRSTNPELMHACGHDAHAAIGVGVLETIAESDFTGTLKVFFQPAEEQIGGGKAIARSGHLDDVDYLYAVHVGLDRATGELVAGVDGFLAVKHLEAEFTGTAAHAGGRPNEGDNAVQAVATAVQNLYAIPRHKEGATRVNAGIVSAGSASNIIPEAASIVGEVRGETTELKDYMWEDATRVIDHAAGMHGCTVDITTSGEAPSATSDQPLVDIITTEAEAVDGVESVLERGDLGGSEDATYLMETVQTNGGLACYIGVGTDHPGGHHTSTFDVDEDSIPIAVDVLSGAIRSVSSNPPSTANDAARDGAATGETESSTGTD